VTAAAEGFRLAETGQRVSALELDLHLHVGLWAVVDRSEDRWVVRTRDGERLTLEPL